MGRDARCPLKREEEKCVLPGRAAARARLLYQICLAEAWRQDGVVDASSGVVHGYLEASQDQKQSENKAGFGTSVLHAASSISAESLFRRCVSRTDAYSSEERRYCDAEQPPRWLQPRVTVKRRVRLIPKLLSVTQSGCERIATAQLTHLRRSLSNGRSRSAVGLSGVHVSSRGRRSRFLAMRDVRRQQSHHY